MQEVTRFRMTTHPVEFDMYYSLNSVRPHADQGSPRPSPSLVRRSGATGAWRLRDNARCLSRGGRRGVASWRPA